MSIKSSCPRSLSPVLLGERASSLLILRLWIPAFAGMTYPCFVPDPNAEKWTQCLHNSHSNFTLCFILCLCLCLPSSVLAGHGFSSAFGNIEWLPEPGRTPDSLLYRLDAVREQSQLLLARTPTDKTRLCLTFAREKLAEIEAMVKAENTAAASAAAEQYRGYIDRALQLLREDTTSKETLSELLATALLEHQYILSVIYTELPVSSRARVLDTITMAQERYQEVAKQLPSKKKGALFFKEEEVRWSVDMATREDEANKAQE